MKKNLILLLTILSISVTTSYGQSDIEKARDLGMTAIKSMDSGDTKNALKLLKEAAKLDPKNMDYPYEMGYAHYLDKNYKEAIKIYVSLAKNEKATDRIWQMLGNCYDVDGKPEKAIETYDEGIKRFPNPGILHLERGNMEMVKEEYNKAMNYYEQGIKVQPEFPSNYYWAAKIYLISTEEVWGMIYGEIFMNMERNSRRTAEISKLLYDTYKSQTSFTSDSTISVSFCKEMTISISDPSEIENMKLPYCMIYEPTLLFAAINTKKININTLNNIRSSFVSLYYSNGHSETHPNALFAYQKEIKDAGHIEAYNHWILMMGDEEAFSEWLEANKDKWDEFVKWFSVNSIVINDTNRFYRGQY